MALTVQYTDSVKPQINAYLAKVKDEVIMHTAVAELRREIGILAGDPSLGTAPTGPFETRRIYKFRLSAGDQPREAQVSYEIKGDDLFILAFSSQPQWPMTRA